MLDIAHMAAWCLLPTLQDELGEGLLPQNTQ